MQKIRIEQPENINHEKIKIANIACTLFGEEFLQNIPFDSSNHKCLKVVFDNLSPKQIVAFYLAQIEPEAKHIPMLPSMEFYHSQILERNLVSEYKPLLYVRQLNDTTFPKVMEIIKKQYDLSDICNSIPPIKNTCCLYKEGDSFYLLS